MNITNTEVFGFETAIRSMRNPKDSWDKSDSYVSDFTEDSKNGFVLGTNDKKLAQTLILCGNEHMKFMRMIHVSADFDMPRYWWSEADTYRFGSKNSCSTMHKLLNNQNAITKEMFILCEEDLDIVEPVINRLEELRIQYISTKNYDEQTRLLLRAKRMLPEGFLQMRTWDTNYAELRNMYFQRRHHRLKEEWVDTLCTWIENLPYSSELITIEKSKEE